ncbi:rcc01693 family protein [Rhizobium tubonense]|uniref:Phage tail assembly chaperone n=1 Tax=Rhizobium tubonense TaxID=484088 RepID=A0A2W4DM28_9HYPH|nr:rcc01693 family protein [Rhizobium tubonense]PZM17084.1 hypothetical protein CPY51_02275 [Rhizobium tubonense]
MDSTAPAPFPWRRVLHVGLSLLRLPPDTLWAMTPIEFHAMAGGFSPRAGTLERRNLRELMEQFPDS